MLEERHRRHLDRVAGSRAERLGKTYSPRGGLTRGGAKRTGISTSRTFRGCRVNAIIAVETLNRTERVLLRRRPVFDPANIARRLLGNEALTPLLRWSYASVIFKIQSRLRIHPLLFGPAVALVELVMLPAVGATPKLGRWPRGEIPLLFVHATSFALAVA